MEYAGRNYNGRDTWECICDCGTQSVVVGKYLRNGKTNGCNGCKPGHPMIADLSGKTFGKWLVLGLSGIPQMEWLCVCECGTQRPVHTTSLTSGRSVSCGCFRREVNTINSTKHGHGGTWKHGGQTKTYKSWKGMLERCNNPKHISFKSYGGRGIVVCDRWKDFTNFLDDMGERQDGTEIDRIDNSGNYEPNNCRWTTRIVNSRNTRRNRYITVNGETLTLTEWNRRMGSLGNAVGHRIDIGGWSETDAVTIPLRSNNHYKRHIP